MATSIVRRASHAPPSLSSATATTSCLPSLSRIRVDTLARPLAGVKWTLATSGNGLPVGEDGHATHMVRLGHRAIDRDGERHGRAVLELRRQVDDGAAPDSTNALPASSSSTAASTLVAAMRGRQIRPDRSDGGTGPAGANQRASGHAAAEAGPVSRRPAGHPGPGRAPIAHQCVPGLSGELRLDQVM